MEQLPTDCIVIKSEHLSFLVSCLLIYTSAFSAPSGLLSTSPVYCDTAGGKDASAVLFELSSGQDCELNKCL